MIRHFDRLLVFVAFTLLILQGDIVHAAVIGHWQEHAPNDWRFSVTSDSGRIRSLELMFKPGAGSSFQSDFATTLFEPTGKLGGTLDDSFLLFPSSVISPGALQAKGPDILKAAFTGFEPFTGPMQVARLITDAQPIASDFRMNADWLGIAVVEMIMGDPFSFVQFPITAEGVLSGPQYDISGDPDFGRAFPGGVQERVFTIFNSGDAELLLGTPSVSGAGGFFSIAGDFPSSVGAGGSADFSVRMTIPSSVLIDTTINGLIEFSTNVEGLPLATLGLTAHPIPEPAAGVLILLGLIGMSLLARRRPQVAARGGGWRV